MKESTPLEKMMNVCCSRLGVQASQARFTIGGECVAPDDMAEKLGLGDGDIINVVAEFDSPKVCKRVTFEADVALIVAAEAPAWYGKQGEVSADEHVFREDVDTRHLRVASCREHAGTDRVDDASSDRRRRRAGRRG